MFPENWRFGGTDFFAGLDGIFLARPFDQRYDCGPVVKGGAKMYRTTTRTELMSSGLFYSGSLAVLFLLAPILFVACGDNIRFGFTVSHSTPPTGVPTISGTVQVGQTLAADTSGISDADGLTNVAYSYQWLADDTEIDGATSSTYTLQSSDNGKVIKVQVTFTDDDGGDESLTSEGTAAVVMGGS